MPETLNSTQDPLVISEALAAAAPETLPRGLASIAVTGGEVVDLSDLIPEPVEITAGAEIPVDSVDHKVVQAKVDDIMTSSAHVLEGTWEKFAVGLALDHTDFRYAGRTHGGSALGKGADRSAMKETPSLLEGAVRTRLTEVVERSQNPQNKCAASKKNTQDVNDGTGFWTMGDLVHSTNYLRVPDILNTGLLCSELHGESAKNDTTPLEADFSEIVSSGHTAATATGNEMSTYSADRGGGLSVIVKFRRDTDAIDYGEESTGNLDSSPSHRTVFVGLPSSEISGIQLVGDGVDSNALIDGIVESGQYIPVYDQEDKLIFTPEEFMIRTEIGIDAATATNGNEADGTEATKNQVLKMSQQLLHLSEKSQSMSYDFSGTIGGSNRRYSHAVHDRKGGEVSMNSREWYQDEDPASKVSIQLDEDGRMLHVWERDGGKLDMFISTFNGQAAPVTEADLPTVRSELAKAFSSMRSNFATRRAALKVEKAEAARKAEEDFGLYG